MSRRLQIGRLELMWAKWTKWTCPFFAQQFVAGGWLRCWYVGSLRMGWKLKQPRVDEWNAQPRYIQTTVTEVNQRPAFYIDVDD